MHTHLYTYIHPPFDTPLNTLLHPQRTTAFGDPKTVCVRRAETGAAVEEVVLELRNTTGRKVTHPPYFALPTSLPTYPILPYPTLPT